MLALIKNIINPKELCPTRQKMVLYNLKKLMPQAQYRYNGLSAQDIETAGAEEIPEILHKYSK